MKKVNLFLVSLVALVAVSIGFSSCVEGKKYPIKYVWEIPQGTKTIIFNGDNTATVIDNYYGNTSENKYASGVCWWGNSDDLCIDELNYYITNDGLLYLNISDYNAKRYDSAIKIRKVE